MNAFDDKLIPAGDGQHDAADAADAAPSTMPGTAAPTGKAARVPKGPKTPKAAKAPKAPKAPKEPKEPKEPKAPKKTLKPWKKLQIGEAASALARSVHYSSKPVNTNAFPTGVRLADHDRPDLPYVAYSTLRVNRHITDYLEGGAASAGVFGQPASVIEGVVDNIYADCDDDQKGLVLKEAAEVLDQGLRVGMEMVDPRLRQLIMPAADGSSVSLTPLHSSPFSRELRQRTTAEQDANPEMIRRRLAVINIGGANSQNVGRHIYQMTRPLVFSAPEESVRLRRAFAVHHQGVVLSKLLPRKLVVDYIDWRRANRLADGRIRSTVHTREEESSLLISIVRAVVQQADEIRQEQLVYLESLGKIVSDAVDPLIAGLLDPERRSRDWPRAFAKQMLFEIEGFRPDQKSASVAQADDLDALTAAIESVLRVA